MGAAIKLNGGSRAAPRGGRLTKLIDTGGASTAGAVYLVSFPTVGLVVNMLVHARAALLAAGVTDAGVPVVTMGATGGGRDARQGFVAERHVARDPRMRRGGDVKALVTIGDSTATAHQTNHNNKT